jgi:hypothetical protein
MDFVRRAELYSQFMTVMETHVDLSENRGSHGMINFAPMADPWELRGIGEAFLAKARGGKLRMNEKNYVGVRGENFYDQPGLWGLEQRALHGRLSDGEAAVLADALERAGNSENFGFPDNRIARWIDVINRHSELPLGERQLLGEASWLYPDYARPVSTAHLTPKERELWGQLVEKSNVLKRSGRPRIDTNNLTKLIMHNWSWDPIWATAGADQIARIQHARYIAMRKLMREEPIQEVTREFLLDTGLLKAMGESLGIKTRVIAPE